MRSQVHRCLQPALVALLVFSLVTAAPAKLDNKTFKELKTSFETVFSAPGNTEEKASLVNLMIEDGESRSWKLLAEALTRESQQWWAIHRELDRASGEYSKMMTKITNFTEDEEKAIKAMEAKVEGLEAKTAKERAALQAVVEGVLKAPEALRKNILKRAGPTSDWPYRAAAMRIAAATMREVPSSRYIQKTLPFDKDHRVRSAGLDALADVESGWENLVIGRLGDDVWGLQLQALRIIDTRELHAAIPHLINLLAVCSPRVQVETGKVLRKFTGENFDPYAEVWQKWWEEHKDDFADNPKMLKGSQSDPRQDVEFYGLRIKSDRILFIIDISASMKKKTTNDNPKDRWKKPPTTTGGDEPPPPPPPEEILSGPKIDVAKHELKKAIKKLGKGTTFNIVGFNHLAKQWKPKMAHATEKNKADAYKWIRALKPAGNTYIDGALRLGFRIAGLENFDKAYPDIFVDTIVLLSDGAPTDNSFNAKHMEPKIILDHVAEWNKRKNVVIHCIGVDLVEGIQFLKDLAAQNGGTYVDR